jgi:dsRNA-specific ribonuclease
MQWEQFAKTITDKCQPEALHKYVLNEKNRNITKEFIKNMMAEHGLKYQPTDIKLFEVAMTHPSYVNCNFSDQENLKRIFKISDETQQNEKLTQIGDGVDAVPLKMVSYERLELLGDSLLKLILTDYIFFRFDSLTSGDLSKLRSCLENRRAFSNFTRKLGLNRYVLINRNLELHGAREMHNKLLCDVFEGFIGAFYLDTIGIKYDDIGNMPDIIDKERGTAFKTIYNFVVKLIEDDKHGFDLPQIIEIDTNYITRLQSEFSERGWGHPVYETIDMPSKTVELKGVVTTLKVFQMVVKNKNGKVLGSSIGSNKKNVKMETAKNALYAIEGIV